MQKPTDQDQAEVKKIATFFSRDPFRNVWIEHEQWRKHFLLYWTLLPRNITLLPVFADYSWSDLTQYLIEKWPKDNLRSLHPKWLEIGNKVQMELLNLCYKGWSCRDNVCVVAKDGYHLLIMRRLLGWEASTVISPLLPAPSSALSSCSLSLSFSYSLSPALSPVSPRSLPSLLSPALSPSLAPALSPAFCSLHFLPPLLSS